MEKEQRNLLYNVVVRCRRLLEEDFATQLEGAYGVHASGMLEPLDDLLHLDAVGRANREAIAATIAHYEAIGASRRQATQRYVRESAFTFLNRLAALKLMEHPRRALIQPSLVAGANSKGFTQFSLISPEAMHGEPDGGYRLYLELLFDDLGRALGVLFDRTAPTSILFASPTCLQELLGLLNAPELAGVWGEDETIGWIYQYFTPTELREEARKASGAPRNSYELAFRNQFYTPRYVVEFLTDNTLGRTWYEMRKGETRLADQCRYLIRRPTEIFLDDPDRWLSYECQPWVRQVRRGNFDRLPDEPTEAELVSISLAFNGYDVADRLGGYGDLLRWGNEWLGRFERAGALPSSSLDLWLLMFVLQRGWRQITSSGPVDETFLTLWRQVYRAWKDAVQADTSGLSQEELLRRPVYIPHRPLMDPRELRVLDPAGGSGHFLLYAFDLLLTIYQEAWEAGLMRPEEFGFQPEPILLHDTVGLNPAANPISNYSLEPVSFDDAYVVITEERDGPDGVDAHTPYIVASAQRFRVPFAYRVKLSEFDYPAALREGQFDEAAGEKFVRASGAFHFEEIPPVTEEEAHTNFLRQLPRLILAHNLHGIDIDRRAAQIAALALWLRAQRAYADLGIKRQNRPAIDTIHVVCAEPMPGEYELLGEFVRDLQPAILGNMLRDIWEKMKLAGEAGSLLQIEKEIQTAVHTARQKLEALPVAYQLTLFSPEQPAERFSRAELDDAAFWNEAEERVLAALRAYAARATDAASVTRRLFAADAAQGMAFIDLLQRPFDVVLMNPPFGAASSGSKAYIARAYPRTKNDLYAAFVERGLALLRPGGYLGAITSRTGFFLTSFQKWREEILLGEANFIAMADLGYGVLDTAMVETAAYVVRNAETNPLLAEAFFVRLLDVAAEERGYQLAAHTAAVQQDLTPARPVRYAVSPTVFGDLPGSPFAYWVNPNVVAKYNSYPTLEGAAGTVRTGLQTGDDFRFVRCWWETLASDMGFQRTDTVGGNACWMTFAKGGPFSPFYSELDLVGKWCNDGLEMKGFRDDEGNQRSVIRNEGFYFRPGLSWAYRTHRFAPYILPSGALISVRGSGIYFEEFSPFLGLALGVSSVADFFIKLSMGRGGHPQFDMGDVKLIPWPFRKGADYSELEQLAERGYNVKRNLATHDECSRQFRLPSLADSQRTHSLQASAKIITDDVTRSELELREVQISIDDLVAEFFEFSASDLSLDEEADEQSPDESEQVNSEESTSQAEGALEERVQNLLMWCVGVAFGRWDVRFALDPGLLPALQGPFDPLPRCTPGALLGTDGLPATRDNIANAAWLAARENVLDVPAAPLPGGEPPTIPASDYPLPIAWNGILVDDPTDPADLVNRVRQVLALLWGERAAAVEQEACAILGTNTLRDYFRDPRKGFFPFHIKRYSKSRRKAPIYWLLQSANRNYAIWLYVHRMDEGTYFTAARDYADTKVNLETTRLDELRQGLAALEGSARKRREREIEQQQKLVGEVTTFRNTLDEIALRRLPPDPNDGVIISIAPLHELTPWKEAGKMWQELRAGKYEWSTMSKRMKARGLVKT